MRTKPFYDVWKAVVTRHGLDPDGDRVPYPTARAIVRAINRRTRIAWRAWDWPDFSITEERPYRQIWNASKQFSRVSTNGLPDDMFYIPTVTYYTVNPLASSDPPVGTPPASGTPPVLTVDPVSGQTWYTLTAPLDAYVSFDQVCLRSIGRVIGIYKSNPRLDGFKHSGITFRVTENGIDLFHVSNPTIFVKYLPAPSRFTMIPYVAGRTYSQGDLVFWGNETYASTVNNPLVAPPDPSWRIMPMPEVLAPYVEAGAYADCMRESHPADQAIAQTSLQQSALADAEANGLLQDEIDVLMAMGQRHSYQQHRPPRRWVRNSLITTPIWSSGTVTTLTDSCVFDGLYPPAPPIFATLESGVTPIPIGVGQAWVDVAFVNPKNTALYHFAEFVVQWTGAGSPPFIIRAELVDNVTTTGFRAVLNSGPPVTGYVLKWRVTS